MQTLATDEVGKSYRSRRVVNGVSLHVNQGEVVGLLGPNGAGKTTTFYMIVGLTPPDLGRILIDGKDITDVPMYLRARNFGISYLPQEPSVFRKLTVEENILAVLEAQPLSWHERREKMEKLIDELGLSHIRKNRGYALSGGERRRTEIARSLATEPKFILLDEPFAGIDLATKRTLFALFAKLKSEGKTIVMVHHDLLTAKKIFDHIVLINTCLIASGPTSDVLSAENLAKTYGQGANLLDEAVSLSKSQTSGLL